MSDEFLYRLREPPRPEFAAALRERVFQAPSRLSKDRLFRIGLAIGLTIAVTACAIPKTRAPLSQMAARVLTGLSDAYAVSLPPPPLESCQFLTAGRVLPSQLSSEPITVSEGSSTSPIVTGFWTTIRAYDLRVAYWTGIEPHYGAFFQGAYGRDQHYLGPGGDTSTCGSSAGCIWYWNWWGNWQSVLLVPKGGWLWTEPPGGPRWQPANYQATLWIG